MSKKRKRGDGLGNRKKFNTKGRSYVRQTVDVVQICKKNNYKSSSIDSKPPIKRNENTQNLAIEIHIFSYQIEDNDFMNNRNHCYQQRQRMAIVYTYEHVFGNLHPNEWKSFNIVLKIIDHLKLTKIARLVVEQMLLIFLYSVNNGIEYKVDREYNK